MFSKIVWLSNDISVMLLTLSQILLYFSYFIYFFIKFYQILLLNSLFLISEVMYVISLKLLICPFISGSFIYNGLIFLSSLCQLSINLSMSTLSMSIGFLEGDQWVFFIHPTFLSGRQYFYPYVFYVNPTTISSSGSSSV